MALQPPRINTTDPNQQDVSEDDDHFSSASEGNSSSDPNASPIPITRVERVDDKALHGEVPGTPAYELRTRDAVPDEIEIVPDTPENRRSRSSTIGGSRSRATSNLSTGSRPDTPGGSPVPKTVVEKVDFKPSHGEVEGTEAKQMRMADAMPDEVREAPAETGKRLEGRSQAESGREAVDVEESEEGRQAWFRSMWEGDAKAEYDEDEDGAVQPDDNDDDFGDDFDEFAEGGEDGDDFGDFDEAADAEEEDVPSQPPQQPTAIPAAPDILAGLPPLNLSACTTQEEITSAITPYINAVLPNSDSKPPHPPPDSSQQLPTSAFQTDRSLSLWQQLVSPPPMQPPNWTRSRIRRLFLVSLGVPVDLDEILPPSKQKRLILPSLSGGFEGVSPRPSTALNRLKDVSGANDSTTSLDSKTGAPKPRTTKPSRVSARPGPPPPPDFDSNAASHLAATTEEALSVYSDQELREHVMMLEGLNQTASKVLEYWLQRKDEGLKEKEALEGVIENLVGFVKGRRK
ncbi:hypothetical protein LTR37_020822 [Vermiconidia calcicola]|uniref:Uncharacterized protein n=1 Tax=Vermiconidia calcicola TaxID=1690605 RepID=A0ACC3MBK6_9PEZI|nr:hypothetical protein LTR37_020822 [Vermiconidia calcicola]